MSEAVQLLNVQTTEESIRAVHGQFTGHITNFNEEQRKNSDENWQRADADMKPVARIPRIVWIYLQSMGISDDPEELARWLDMHPEYKRTEKHLSNTRIVHQFHDLGHK